MESKETFGDKINPIIVELSDTILEYNAYIGAKPFYSMDAFMGATHIFMDVMMDKMYDLQSAERMAEQDRLNMAEALGKELRKLIKSYTNIDTHAPRN